MPRPRPARAAATSDAFARLLGAGGDTSLSLGIEHEFVVRGPDGEARDFRTLIHRLAVPGRRLDPGDANAYRLPWGGALTADGPEAEIATPPVALGRGATTHVARIASNARSSLLELLPEGLGLEGYSTHISVSAPDDLLPRMAALYARTFAIPLMLFTDGPDSPGVLIRPRPGRLELCLEYVTDDHLAAAALFAAGSVAATARAVASSALDGLPPTIALAVAPATARFGWFVDRAATGTDLHEQGRETELHLEPDGDTTAGEHLRLAWSSARAAAIAGGISDVAAEAALDLLIEGGRPLPCESDAHDPIEESPAGPPPQTSVAEEPLGDLLRPRQRPAFAIEAVWSTWACSIFRFRAGPRQAYACIPRASLARFLRLADAGELDGVVLRYLDAANGARPLLEAGQTGEPGLFDVVGPAKDLLPQEPGLGFTGGGPRRGKRRRHDEHRRHGREHQPPTPEVPKAQLPAAKASRMSTRSKVIIAAATAALVAAGAIAFATTGGNDAGATGPGAGTSPSTTVSASTGASPNTSPTPAGPPPIGQAWVGGTYRFASGSAGGAPKTLTFASSCSSGPCGARVSGEIAGYGAKVAFGASFAAGAYTGSDTTDLGCPPPPDVRTAAWPLSLDFKLRVLQAKMIDGVWTATLLSGPLKGEAPRVQTVSGGTTHICNKAHFTRVVTYKRTS